MYVQFYVILKKGKSKQKRNFLYKRQIKFIDVNNKCYVNLTKEKAATGQPF